MPGVFGTDGPNPGRGGGRDAEQGTSGRVNIPPGSMKKLRSITLSKKRDRVVSF